MTPVCPFTKASHPDYASGKRPGQNQNSQQAINDNNCQQDATISPKCPFGKVIDVVISIAKVADVDRNIGNEDTASAGFKEAIKLLESLTISAEEVGLEQRRLSLLEFLNSQLGRK